MSAQGACKKKRQINYFGYITQTFFLEAVAHCSGRKSAFLFVFLLCETWKKKTKQNKQKLQHRQTCAPRPVPAWCGLVSFQHHSGQRGGYHGIAPRERERGRGWERVREVQTDWDKNRNREERPLAWVSGLCDVEGEGGRGSVLYLHHRRFCCCYSGQTLLGSRQNKNTYLLTVQFSYLFIFTHLHNRP